MFTLLSNIFSQICLSVQANRMVQTRIFNLYIFNLMYLKHQNNLMYTALLNRNNSKTYLIKPTVRITFELADPGFLVEETIDSWREGRQPDILPTLF